MAQSQKLQTRKFEDDAVIAAAISESKVSFEIGVPKMIALGVPSMQAKIIVRVTEPIYIGRSFADDEVEAFLDLHHFGAEDLGVSRKHLRLWSENGELFVEDLGSTNGTRFNSVRMTAYTPQRVHHGDQISLSNLVLTVEFIYDLLA